MSGTCHDCGHDLCQCPESHCVSDKNEYPRWDCTSESCGQHWHIWAPDSKTGDACRCGEYIKGEYGDEE